jgi:hypothetical protein
VGCQDFECDADVRGYSRPSARDAIMASGATIAPGGVIAYIYRQLRPHAATTSAASTALKVARLPSTTHRHL